MREEVGGGETIFLPRNIPHQWLHLSETGSMIYAVTPAGALEDIFVEFDYLKEPPSKELLEEIHSRHRIKKHWTGINVG